MHFIFDFALNLFFIIWTELQFDLNQRDYLNWEVIVLFSYWETTAFVYNIENGYTIPLQTEILLVRIYDIWM